MELFFGSLSFNRRCQREQSVQARFAERRGGRRSQQRDSTLPSSKHKFQSKDIEKGETEDHFGAGYETRLWYMLLSRVLNSSLIRVTSAKESSAWLNWCSAICPSTIFSTSASIDSRS